MKVLLLTGRLAKDAAVEYASMLSCEVLVHVCPVDVAAFLSIPAIAAELSGMDLSGLDYVVVPGMVRGDVSCLAKDFGVRFVKGPRNLSDLPLVDGRIDCLSPERPADDLLFEEVRKRAVDEISAAYDSKGSSFGLGKKERVYPGSGVCLVAAEVVDAPLLSGGEYTEKVRHYISSGARIIDLGMVAGQDNSDKIAGLIESARSVSNLPVSIDSLNPGEILAAADAGADLVISVSEENLDVVSSLEIPFVVIPRDKKGRMPREPAERAELVEKIIRETGDKKVIADLVLEPLGTGFVRSLDAYRIFSEGNPKVPLLMGAGNVTELADADSPGVNMVLAAVASELGVSILLSTEAGQKTVGSVAELRRACEMMYLAKMRRQPPKDLGVDLLVLKDKKRRGDAELAEEKAVPCVEASGGREEELEDCSFRIYLGRGINAVYYKSGRPKMRIRGRRAEDVYSEIISRKLVSSLSHAAYLGAELSKAEEALALGKNYVQDEPLFRRTKD